MIWKIDGLLDRLGLRGHTLGLALSGGGAKGFSHIGVFKAMESFGMKPDVLSGVSAGSIAAALYGAGLTPDEIIECFSETTSLTDFAEWSIPKKAFLKLDRFRKLLENWLPVRYLEDMKIPTIICATDFDKAQSIGWGKGEIAPRVVASCSIPIIFHPVKINGVNYVDGGVLRNLPAWAIRKYCDNLIGVNCNPLRKDIDGNGTLINIALRSFQVMMKQNVVQDLKLCDCVIEMPEMWKVKTFDLKSLNKVVTLGYDQACKVLETYKTKL